MQTVGFGLKRPSVSTQGLSLTLKRKTWNSLYYSTSLKT
jgi:hypothetical protein